MAVTIETAVSQYTLTGTGQTLNVPWYILAQTDAAVTLTHAGVDTDLVLNTDYTMAGEGNENGFTVTMIAGVSGDTVTVYRSSPYVQNTVYQENTRFPAAVTEHSLDYLEFQIQQLSAMVVRAVRIGITSPSITELNVTNISTSTSIITATKTGNQISIGSSDYNQMVSSILASVLASLGVTAFGRQVIQCADATALRTLIALETAANIEARLGMTEKTIGYCDSGTPTTSTFLVS